MNFWVIFVIVLLASLPDATAFSYKCRPRDPSVEHCVYNHTLRYSSDTVFSVTMAGKLVGVPIPTLDWKSSNLPEEFRKFKRSVEFIFNGPLKDESEDVKVQYLLMWVGPDGADIRDGWQLSSADSVKLDIHWSKFDAYVKPKSTFRVARFQLHALKQGMNETIDAFLTRTKVILSKCQYSSDMYNVMLLDTIIAGVYHESVQRKLVSKDDTLTVDTALDIIRAYENTTSQMNDIQGATRKVHAVNKFVTRQSGTVRRPHQDAAKSLHNTLKPGTCWNCGNTHARSDKCPAADVKCHSCGKTGHFKAVCLSKTKGATSSTGPHHQGKYKGKPRNRKIHVVDDADANNDADIGDELNAFGFDTIFVETQCCDTNMETVTPDTGDSDTKIEVISKGIIVREQAFANIKIKPRDKEMTLKCKVDTGAQSNVMPLRVFREIFPDRISDGKPVGLQSTTMNLKAYNGSKIEQFGLLHLKCTHQDVTDTVPFFVTDTKGDTLLGLTASTQFGIISLNCHDTPCQGCHAPSVISAVQQDSTVDVKPYGSETGDARQDMLGRHENCFGGIGAMPEKHHITMAADAQSTIYPAKRIPEALRPKFKSELQRMIDNDIICRVDKPTDWVSSIVCVTKANGDLRICLDPVELNKWIKREHYYMPTLDDVTPQLTDAKWFSVLDAKSGYWNIVLDEESQLLTTFNTPFGRFCFKRLPFGLISSQDVFQKRIDQTFEGLTGVVGIADDIVVFGKSEQDHDKNLEAALNRTESAGLKLNATKCVVKKKRVKFYGHYLSEQGLESDPEKIRAIQEMPVPKSASELQTLLGMANYLSKFTPNLATLTAPLRDLTRQDVEYLWQPHHQKAFDELKSVISSPAALAYFDGRKPVVVQTDASMRGAGAVLLQDGRPVAYASKSFTDRESNYSNIEREMLAVVFGLERFHYYVYGRQVTVESDHKPLESIAKKNISQAPPRLQRMLLKIQKYDYEIKYIPGKNIPVADALSRAPIPGDEIEDMDITVHEVVQVSPAKLDEIREHTEKDPLLTSLKHTIMTGWPETRSQCPSEIHGFWNYRDELSVHDGIILKGTRTVIPEALQPRVLNLIHTGHQGITKCRLRARNSVFWPGLNNDIDELVRQCATCQQNQKSQPSEPMKRIEAERPWSVVGSDLFHWNNVDYILVVDYFSSFPIIRKLRSTTSTSIINSLRSIFAEYGLPETFISDNGTQYTSDEFAQFVENYGFFHTTSSPHYHQSNGKSERFVDVMKQTLTKTLESQQDVHLALLCVRTTPLGPNLPSPAELLFGRKLKSNLPCVNLAERDDDLRRALRELRTKHIPLYDSHSRSLPELTPGQSVRVQDPITKRWKPGVVKSKEEEPRSYLVQQPSGSVLRRNRRHLRATGERFRFPGPESEDSGDVPYAAAPQPEPPDKSEAAPPPSPESPHKCHMTEPHIPETRSGPIITRSGRAVYSPNRLIQEV